MATASILHADLDAFYASVEQRDRPELLGRPVIVGEGVVMAASYEARIVGVRSAMNGGEARRRCPHAVVVPPRMEAYAEASKAVFACFDDVTPLVEPLSIDEAFLDVSGARRLLGEPRTIAEALRARVRDEVGLPLSIGVARTKFLAKVASQRAKPDGLLVVEPDAEMAFLHPLPVEALWGVGPVTAERLHDQGIRTVGQLAETPEDTLVGLLGPASGRHLRHLAWNRDPRPVETGRRDRSMGAQRALGHRRRTVDELRLEILALTEKVAGRLRRAERLTRTVTVRYRDASMTGSTRSRTLSEPTDQTASLTGIAVDLLRDLVDGPEGPGSALARNGCSLVGITFSNLCRPDAVQLSLDLADTDPSNRSGAAPPGSADLDEAVDAIRDRFGGAAVGRASLGGRGQGLPTLPRPTALDHEP
ncbi:MAG: DNA polymerase IV [Actinomycetota bacterium]